MKRAWVLRWPRGTKMPGQPLNCGGETSGEHCILGPPCYSSFTYTVTNAASKSPSWLGSSRPQTIGRSALPSSVWSRWHSLFGHREEHVLCRGVTWWGRQTSASLTALPLTATSGYSLGPLSCSVCSFKLQVISIATRLGGRVSDVVCMKGLSSPVLSKWQLLLLVFPRATASNCLLPWYFFSLTGYLWRIDFLGFIFGLSKTIRNFNTWTFVALVPQNCWGFESPLSFPIMLLAARRLQEMV